MLSHCDMLVPTDLTQNLQLFNVVTLGILKLVFINTFIIITSLFTQSPAIVGFTSNAFKWKLRVRTANQRNICELLFITRSVSYTHHIIHSQISD